MIGKATGVSGRDAVDGTKYAATATNAWKKDVVSGRSGKEREAALEKKRAERRDMSSQGEDGVYGWQKKLNKEKEQKQLKEAKDAADAAELKARKPYQKDIFNQQNEVNQKANELAAVQQSQNYLDAQQKVTEEIAGQVKLEKELKDTIDTNGSMESLEKEKTTLGSRPIGLTSAVLREQDEYDRQKAEIETKITFVSEAKNKVNNQEQVVKQAKKDAIEIIKTEQVAFDNADSILKTTKDKSDTEGKIAKEQSQKESAEKIIKETGNIELANKINTGTGPKKKSFTEDDLIKMAEKIKEDDK